MAHAQGRTITPLAECSSAKLSSSGKSRGTTGAFGQGSGSRTDRWSVTRSKPGRTCCRNGGNRRDGDRSRPKSSRSAKRGLLCCAWIGDRDWRMCPAEYLRLRGSRSKSRRLVNSGTTRFERSSGKAARSASGPSGLDRIERRSQVSVRQGIGDSGAGMCRAGVETILGIAGRVRSACGQHPVPVKALHNVRTDNVMRGRHAERRCRRRGRENL